MSKESLLNLGWENVCECVLYPNPHSHSFLLGKDIKKNCSDCGEIEPKAQMNEILFGGNKARLWNAYECNCKRIGEAETLYNDIPRSYKEIHRMVSSRFGG